MVRTYPVASPHFDPARVAAWSAAIALHLLAFLLLLIPATYQAVQAPREKSPVRLIEKIPPPPAPPVPVPPKEIVQVVPKPRTQPVVPPLPAPTATVEETQGIALPAAEPAAPQLAPSIDTSTPLAGAQLQYLSLIHI